VPAIAPENTEGIAMLILARRMAWLLCLVVLSACVVKQPGGMVDRKLAEADPATMGAVVGSFGVKIGVGETVSGYQQLLIRRLQSTSEDVTVSFQANLDDFPPDFRDKTSQATIFALKLPAGWYEIYNFRMVRPGIYGSSTTFSARSDLSFLFQVEAGKATYVGEYLSVPVEARNIFRAVPIPGPSFEVDDKRTRDLAFARTKWPDFEFDKVNDFIPDVAAIKNPLFVRAGSK
jgi:hypothetical protein